MLIPAALKTFLSQGSGNALVATERPAALGGRHMACISYYEGCGSGADWDGDYPLILNERPVP